MLHSQHMLPVTTTHCPARHWSCRSSWWSAWWWPSRHHSWLSIWAPVSSMVFSLASPPGGCMPAAHALLASTWAGNSWTWRTTRWRDQCRSPNQAHRGMQQRHPGHATHSLRHAAVQGCRLHLHLAEREEMGSKRGKSKLEAKMMAVRRLGRQKGKPSRDTVGTGQGGMLDVKNSLLIPSTRKDYSYQNAMSALKILDTYIRDVQKNTYLLFLPSYFRNEWCSQQSQPTITISNPVVLFPFQTEKEIIWFWADNWMLFHHLYTAVI